MSAAEVVDDVAIEHRPTGIADLDELIVTVDTAGPRARLPRPVDIMATLDELEDVVGRLCDAVATMVVALDRARLRAGRETRR